MNKKIKIILISSIILNIVFAGLIIGHSFKYKSHPMKKIVRFIDNSSISESEKKTFKDNLHKLKPKKHKRRFINNKARDILISKEFDKDEFITAMSKEFSHRDSKRNLITALLADIINKLSLDERIKLEKEIK